MKNCTVRLQGTKCTIEFEVDKSFGLSSTGKTTIVASSEGAAKVEGTDVRFTFSAYKK